VRTLGSASMPRPGATKVVGYEGEGEKESLSGGMTEKGSCHPVALPEWLGSQRWMRLGLSPPTEGDDSPGYRISALENEFKIKSRRDYIHVYPPRMRNLHKKDL